MFWLMTFYSLSTIFQGLRFLSHCPIKKDDIMYVIFSKIESLEKVCHCLPDVFDAEKAFDDWSSIYRIL